MNGYVNVTADVPTHIHETIYDKTDELFAGATDFRGDRQHNPLNNILPLVPELQVVLESPEVRGALTSILGNGYVMHPHRHCHPNFGAACKPKLAVKSSGSTPSGKENGEERLMMPLHKDGHAGGKRPRHRTSRWAILFYYPQPCLADQGPTCIIPGTQYIREFMLDGERQRHEVHAEGGNGTRLLSENFLNRNLVPMSGELGTVWIMHFDMEPILHICDAAHGLAATGVSAVPALIVALQDERENVRASAAYALGEMGPVAAEAVDGLIALLTDESEEVRRHATSALGMIKVPVSKTVPALIEVLEDREDTDLAFFAAQALTRIGPDATEAVPALREALMSESAYVRGFSSEALGRIGTAEALQALVPFLRTARWFNYVKKSVPAFSIALKDAKSAPSDAGSLTKLIQEWAEQKDIPLSKPETISQDSDTQFQVTFSDGRQATARVEGDVLNLYHKRRVEAGFKAYR